MVAMMSLRRNRAGAHTAEIPDSHGDEAAEKATKSKVPKERKSKHHTDEDNQPRKARKSKHHDNDRSESRKSKHKKHPDELRKSKKTD